MTFKSEVPPAISWRSKARTKTLDPTAPFDDRLGCKNASFRWTLPSEVHQENKQATFPKRSLLQQLSFNQVNFAPQVQVTTGEGNTDDKGFQMNNLTVWFKRGVINLVTGPTGSGKSSCEFHVDRFSTAYSSSHNSTLRDLG